MTADPAHPPPIRFGLLPRVLATARTEARRIESDPILRKALEDEQRIGRDIAWIGRTTAMVIIAVLLPFLNPTWGVLYYEALLAVFLILGWTRHRIARFGRSAPELAFIFADLVLLTFMAVVPNPFVQEDMPTALSYRFDTFLYFFVILGFATLAHSWRTVWTIAMTIAVLWLGTLVLVVLFGHRVPEFSEAVQGLAARHPRLVQSFDMNDPQIPLRVQEIVVLLIVAASLTLKGWRTNQLIKRQARIAAERANLSRYFAPTVVDLLATGRQEIGGARRREVAVMFVDIVGFTAMAERQSDEEVMSLLRRYYSEIEKAVFDNNGTLDKYLGDGVMATFGTPAPGEDDALNAIRAARRVVADIDAMCAEGRTGGAPAVRVSVGVHFGPATVGDVGPSRRLEFAVIGDTVNVASRLETATRNLGCRIVCSDALVARAGGDAGALDGFVRHDGLMLRGRTAPIDVWLWGQGAEAPPA